LKFSFSILNFGEGSKGIIQEEQIIEKMHSQLVFFGLLVSISLDINFKIISRGSRLSSDSTPVL